MLILGKSRFQGAFIRPIDSLDFRNTLLFCFVFVCLFVVVVVVVYH